MNRRQALAASIGVLSGSVLSAKQQDRDPKLESRFAREPMYTVLRKLAENIVEHVAHEKDKLGAGHLAEGAVISTVHSILMATLEHEGFVRLQRVTDK